MFKADRSLINAQFEGYKLDPLLQEEHVVLCDIPRKVTQTAVLSSTSSRSRLSFEDVRSRIRHNHLTMGLGGQALYIDEDMGVNIVTVESEQCSITRLCELPLVIQSDEESTTQYREYASATPLGPKLWFVSDGSGRAYILDEEHKESSGSDSTTTILSAYEFYASTTDGGQICPFTIWTSTFSPETATVLVSSKDLSMGSSISHLPDKSHKFSLHAIRLQNPAQYHPDIQTLNPLWTLHSQDLPIYADFSFVHNAFLVLSSSSYRQVEDESITDMSIDEESETSITRPSGHLDQPKPPPYSWSQTADSLTLAFPLPSWMATKDIRVQLYRKALSISVQASQSIESLPPFPSYTMKQLWGEIITSESLWTWDKEDNHSYGILMLHLEKTHESTRWPHVFASDEAEVAETLDPSELARIRDELEKYTGFVDGSGELGSGIPSLAEGEVDADIDTDVGRRCIATWVREDGSIVGAPIADTPLDVLSTPLPLSPALFRGKPSVVVKRTVDGLSIEPSEIDSSSTATVPSWTHTFTFNALAFVLASKRDTRFSFHIPDRAVFAFENGGSGNVYIYRKTTNVRDLKAKQAILKVSGGSAGSLLGVGAIMQNDEIYIICLCENKLSLIKHVV